MDNITYSKDIVLDEHTQYVIQKFDIQNSEKVETVIGYDISEADTFDWNIGMIVGNSGSGKTSILRTLGLRESVVINSSVSLISAFDMMSPEEACRLLSSVGLSSVPSWLKSYNTLSNGERFRADIAYMIATTPKDEIIVIDEFTSVVDRDVAKAMSYSVQKYLRANNRKMVIASCHYDIIEWLMPDWTCNLHTGGVLKKHDYLRSGRPEITLQISRVDSSVWNIFKEHHYLTQDVNKSCKFLLFEWNGRPVGINAVIAQPSGHFKNGVRESRIVVLPDFQGLRLGTAISNITAGIFLNEGYRYFTKTIHPAIGNYRNNNPHIWKPTSKNGAKESAQNQMGGTKKGWNVLCRTSYCHEYIGEPIEGYSDLVHSIDYYKPKNKRKTK